jgi:large subunit ribosomal protein L7/L12
MSSKHVKLIEEISKMSVLDLNDLVKELETFFGVSAAMPVAAAPTATAAAPAAEQAQEKSEYKVTLQNAGSEKIKVIKELRALIPNVSLTDAKGKVEEAPTVIGESIAKEDAFKMKKALEAVGATVTLS